MSGQSPPELGPVFSLPEFRGSEVYGALIYRDPPRSRRLRLLNRLRRILGWDEQAEIVAWLEREPRRYI